MLRPKDKTPSPLNSSQGFAQKLRRNLEGFSMSAVVIMAGLITPFLAPPKQADAWSQQTGHSVCTNSDFNWNWKDKVNAWFVGQGAPSGTTLDEFHTVLIYKVPNDSRPFVHVIYQEPKLAEFYKFATDEYRLQMGIHPAEYGNPSWKHAQLQFNSSKTDVTVVGAVSSYTTRTDTTPTFYSSVACIYTAKGFDYAASWDSKYWQEQLPTQGEEKCDALNVACWIGKAFQGIGDGFNLVGQAIVKAITWIFVPESADIAWIFSEFDTFMEQKLGFLYFPVAFGTDVFATFSNSQTWCNASNCTLSAGNVWGAPLNIDVLKLRETTPTLYNLFVYTLRGVTVASLIFMLRHKYHEVVKA